MTLWLFLCVCVCVQEEAQRLAADADNFRWGHVDNKCSTELFGHTLLCDGIGRVSWPADHGGLCSTVERWQSVRNGDCSVCIFSPWIVLPVSLQTLVVRVLLTASRRGGRLKLAVELYPSDSRSPASLPLTVTLLLRHATSPPTTAAASTSTARAPTAAAGRVIAAESVNVTAYPRHLTSDDCNTFTLSCGSLPVARPNIELWFS